MATPIQGIDSVVCVSSGFDSFHFIRSDKTLWAMGRNYRGQLGLGDTTDRFVPTQVSALQNVLYVTAEVDDQFGEFSLFVTEDGQIWSCGSNNYGNLGIGNTQDQNLPVAVLCNCTSILNKTKILQENPNDLIYPNPTRNNFYIQDYNNQYDHYQLTDISGKCLQSGKVNPNKLINIENFPKGMYFIYLFNQQNQKLNNYRIIKSE
jgi:hypothetical protein